MLQNSIGQFNFLELRGVPDFIGERMEAIQRPGVDGTTFRKLGQHGRPFQCLSRADMLNVAEANNYAKEYKDLLGQGSQELFRAGIPYSIYSVAFVVLGVKPVVTRALSTSAGGLHGTLARAWLECIWQLMPVDITEEEEEA